MPARTIHTVLGKGLDFPHLITLTILGCIWLSPLPERRQGRKVRIVYPCAVFFLGCVFAMFVLLLVLFFMRYKQGFSKAMGPGGG